MPDNALTHEPRGERWEHFHHDADMGVRGYGSSPDKAYEQAALALTAVVADLSDLHAVTEVAISCEAPDMEYLFADWLNAVIYEMGTRKMLFSRYEVRLEGGRLQGRAWGEPVDVKKHQPAVEVKGATYTELSVREEAGEWLAQCVVDV